MIRKKTKTKEHWTLAPEQEEPCPERPASRIYIFDGKKWPKLRVSIEANGVYYNLVTDRKENQNYEWRSNGYHSWCIYFLPDVIEMFEELKMFEELNNFEE